MKRSASVHALKLINKLYNGINRMKVENSRVKSILSLTIVFLTLSANADVSVLLQRKDGYFENTGKLASATIYPEKREILFWFKNSDRLIGVSFDVVKAAGLSNKEFVDMLKEASKSNKKLYSITATADDETKMKSIVNIFYDER